MPEQRRGARKSSLKIVKKIYAFDRPIEKGVQCRRKKGSKIAVTWRNLYPNL
jgi:hypothetical protein